MKKLIFTIALLIGLSALYPNLRRTACAEEYTWSDVTYLFDGPIKRYTDDGDVITFQVRSDTYKYRMVKNGSQAIEFDIGNKYISPYLFEETAKYYYVAGFTRSVSGDRYGGVALPIVLRFEKDLSYYTYKIDDREEFDWSRDFRSIRQFGPDFLLLTERVMDRYPEEDLFELLVLNDRMEFIGYIDLGENVYDVCVAYDLIDVYGNMSAFHEYYNENMEKVEEYKSEETRTSFFMIYEDCVVNGEEKVAGSVFSEPGKYVLEDGVHERKTIILDPKIEISGNKDGEMFNDTVEYKVSSGNISINGKGVGLNGRVTKSGKYTITVKGLGDYVYEETFFIAPKLLTRFNDDGTITSGSTVNFTGEATLNGETIEDGYVITTPGNYVMRLSVGGQITDEYHFVVPSDAVTSKALTREDNRMLYFIFISILVVAASGVTAMIIIRIRQNKH